MAIQTGNAATPEEQEDEKHIGQCSLWQSFDIPLMPITLISVLQGLQNKTVEFMTHSKTFDINLYKIEYGNAATGKLSGVVECGLIAFGMRYDAGHPVIITEETFPWGLIIPLPCVLCISDAKGVVLWKASNFRRGAK